MIEQFRLLLSLIYESDNCFVDINAEEKVIRFKTKNNGTISRGNGTHGAAMPALAFALGNRFYDNQSTMSTGRYMPDVFEVYYNATEVDVNSPVGHKPFNSLAEIRDAMLDKEFHSLLISAQNYEYFLLHRKPHPNTGYGATSCEDLCRTDDLLDGFKVRVFINDDGYTEILFLEGSDKSEVVKNQILSALQISPTMMEEVRGEKTSLVIKLPILQILQTMKAKKVNYQGVIPLDEDGKILIAHRISGDRSLGFSTAGGHCSDPYNPLVGAITELSSEYGLKLKSDVDLGNIVSLGKVGDAQVFMIREQDFVYANPEVETYCRNKRKPFKAEEEEFLRGSEEKLSLRQIGKRGIPLRNILSLELYMQYCSDILFQKLGAEVVIEGTTNVGFSGEVKLPSPDFGIIKIKCGNIEQQIVGFEKHGIDREFLEINTKDNSIVIDKLSPQQIIDIYDGKRIDLKAPLSQDLEDETQIAAAKKIQTAYKRSIFRHDLKNSTTKLLGKERAIKSIEIKSLRNLKKIIKRLGPLTEDEQKMMEFLRQKEYWLHHATDKSAFDAIMDSSDKSLLDSHEIARRWGRKKTNSRPIYDTVGMGAQIYFSIGSKNAETVGGKDYSFSFSFSNLLEHDRKALGDMWASDHFYSYIEKRKAAPLQFGNVKNIVSYELTEVGGVKDYIKTYKFEEDGADSRQLVVRMGEEVFALGDIVKSMALKFIENMRMIGHEKPLVQKIFSQPYDIALIEKAMDGFFDPYKFILHCSTKFQLGNIYSKERILTPENQKIMSEEITEAIKRGDITRLTELENEEYLFHGNFYNNKLSDGSYPLHPIVAAIRFNQLETLQYLMARPCYRGFFKDDENNFIGFDTLISYDNVLFNIVRELYDSRNEELLKAFVRKNPVGFTFILTTNLSKEMWEWFSFLDYLNIKNWTKEVWGSVAKDYIKLSKNEDLSALLFMIDRAETEGDKLIFSEEDVLPALDNKKFEVVEFLIGRYGIKLSFENTKKFLEDKDTKYTAEDKLRLMAILAKNDAITGDEKLSFISKDATESQWSLLYAALLLAGKPTPLISDILEKCSQYTKDNALETLIYIISLNVYIEIVKSLVAKGAKFGKGGFLDKEDFLGWFFVNVSLPSRNVSDFFNKISDEEFVKIFQISDGGPTRADVIELLEKVDASKLNISNAKPEILRATYRLCLSVDDISKALDGRFLAANLLLINSEYYGVWLELLSRITYEELGLINKIIPSVCSCIRNRTIKNNDELLTFVETINTKCPTLLNDQKLSILFSNLSKVKDEEKLDTVNKPLYI